MKFALTGSSGLLGSSFVRYFRNSNIEYQVFDWRFFLEKSPLEISKIFTESSISHFIHCAANTNINDCQLYPDNCLASNSLIPKIIASACSQAGIFLCFISSTGIYKGDIDGSPSTEFTSLDPLNIYHKSKVYAEGYVQSLTKHFLIARVGWLFGDNTASNKNFIKGRLKEAMSNKGGIIYSDPYQLGNPTNVDDCVNIILKLMLNKYTGIFNVVNQGSVTRYEYIQEIYNIANIKVSLKPIEKGRFANPYKVSVNESAINFNLKLLGLDEMPDFRNSLRTSVLSILSSMT